MLVLFSVSAGCGANLPPLGTVSGTVTQDGQPVEGVSIEFIPVEGGRPSMALTNELGEYEAKYLADVDGALIGTHRIRYQNNGPQPEASDDPDAMVMPGQAPTSVNGRVMTPDEIVVEDGSNEINFEFVSK
jgi:hypothetical protein